MAKNNDTIIIIAGHGKMAFNKKDLFQAVSGYMKHYKNVKLIGNGKTNLSLDDIKESLADVKNSKFDVCVYAHGEQRPDGFNFCFGDNIYVHCSKLFDVISETTSNPVNLHIFSCHGGGALEKSYTKRLPDGSAAFSCCDYKNSLPGQDVKDFFKNLNSMDLKDNSIESMLYLYLASMQNRNAVMLARKNSEPINLLNCMLNIQGKPLSETQINEIKSAFGPLFSPETLNTVIKKFATDGEYNMYAVEIGCAMAITHLIHKNDLAELNYNKYQKQNCNSLSMGCDLLDLELFEIRNRKNRV